MREKGVGVHRLPLETLSNSRPAGPGAAASPSGEDRPGPGGAPEIGAGQRVSASRRRWREPAAGGWGRFPSVCGGTRCTPAPLRAGIGGGAGPGGGRCRPRSPRGFPGLAGPSGAAASGGQGDSEPPARLPESLF